MVLANALDARGPRSLSVRATAAPGPRPAEQPQHCRVHASCIVLQTHPFARQDATARQPLPDQQPSVRRSSSSSGLTTELGPSSEPCASPAAIVLSSKSSLGEITYSSGGGSARHVSPSCAGAFSLEISDLQPVLVAAWPAYQHAHNHMQQQQPSSCQRRHIEVLTQQCKALALLQALAPAWCSAQ